MGETCCKACGSVHMHEKRGHWGPHRVRVTCQDCGRFVKWGAVHRETRRIETTPTSTVGLVLHAIDRELKGMAYEDVRAIRRSLKQAVIEALDECERKGWHRPRDAGKG